MTEKRRGFFLVMRMNLKKKNFFLGGEGMAIHSLPGFFNSLSGNQLVHAKSTLYDRTGP